MRYYYYRVKDKLVQNFTSIKTSENGLDVLEFYIDSDHPPTDEQIKLKYKEVLLARSDKLNTERLASLREKRDTLLSESDWTQTADSPLSAELKEQWKTYRQALRDLPSSNKPCWPTPPPTK